MKSALNLQASTFYNDLFEDGNRLNDGHPSLQLMQELSNRVAGPAPTALDRIEVYKECHRLADDLYRLTGSKRLSIHVLSIGDMLLSRILGNSVDFMQANQ